jgi:hypothetical protein
LGIGPIPNPQSPHFSAQLIKHYFLKIMYIKFNLNYKISMKNLPKIKEISEKIISENSLNIDSKKPK